MKGWLMAEKGNGWNSLMQQKGVQLFLYGLCVVFCFGYAIGGIIELLTPERAQVFIDSMGAPGYYAMTIIRFVVLVGCGVAFLRVMYKSSKNGDGDDD